MGGGVLLRSGEEKRITLRAGRADARERAYWGRGGCYPCPRTKRNSFFMLLLAAQTR